MKHASIRNSTHSDIPAKQLIRLVRMNREIMKRLIKTKDAFIRQVLLNALAGNYKILGCPMPDVALLGTQVNRIAAA